MRTKRYGILAGVGVAAVVGALAVGAAAAQAPAGAGATHQAMLGRAAAILGVSEARLNEAFAQAHDQALEDAVKAGRLTQAQADWMKQRHAAMAAGGFGPGGGMMGQGMMGGRGPMMGGRFGGMGYGPPSAATPTPGR